MFSRPALLGPVILIIGLAVGYPIYWFYAASIGEDLVTRWIEERRLESIDVSHGSIERSGFPPSGTYRREVAGSPVVRTSFPIHQSKSELRVPAVGFQNITDRGKRHPTVKEYIDKNRPKTGFSMRRVSKACYLRRATSSRNFGRHKRFAGRGCSSGNLLSTKQFLTDIEFPDARLSPTRIGVSGACVFGGHHTSENCSARPWKRDPESAAQSRVFGTSDDGRVSAKPAGLARCRRHIGTPVA